LDYKYIFDAKIIGEKPFYFDEQHRAAPLGVVKSINLVA